MAIVGGYTDQTLTCRDCAQPFLFEAGEQQFFAEKNFTPPSRCKGCRQKRKAEKDGAAMAPSPSAPTNVSASARRPPEVEVVSRRQGGGRPQGGGGRQGGGGGRRRHDDDGY